MSHIIAARRGDLQRSSSLPEHHERRIDRDARQPSREARPAVKVPEMHERSQQRVLHRILRILAVPGYALRNT